MKGAEREMWQGYDNEGCMPGDRERLAHIRVPRTAQSERSRLERDVIEAAKEWQLTRLEQIGNRMPWTP